MNSEIRPRPRSASLACHNRPAVHRQSICPALKFRRALPESIRGASHLRPIRDVGRGLGLRTTEEFVAVLSLLPRLAFDTTGNGRRRPSASSRACDGGGQLFVKRRRHARRNKPSAALRGRTLPSGTGALALRRDQACAVDRIRASTGQPPFRAAPAFRSLSQSGR